MITHTTLPSGLYRSRPRDVRLSGGGRAVMAAIVVLCLSAPVVAMLLHRQAVREAGERDALLQTGVVTDGVVTRLARESKDDKRSTVYYQFDANGQTATDRAKVPLTMWQTLTVGSALPIRYLADDPSVNTPDGVASRPMPLALGYILATLLLIIAAITGAGLQSQRRLLSDGRAAMAVVRRVKRHRGQHGTHYSVAYEFPLLNGAMQAGTMRVQSHPPEVGASIAVLYNDERPKRSRLYPFSLVALDD